MRLMGSYSSYISTDIILYGLLIIYLLLALWKLPWPIVYPTMGLDPSWNIGINLAFLDNLQFGKDVAFTYGVLGFLYNPLLLDYNLWRLALFFALFVNFLYVISVYLFLRALSAKWYHYVILIPILLFTFPHSTVEPPILLLAISMCIYAIIIRSKPDWITSFGLIAIGSLLSIASLIKFNMLLVSVYIVIITFFVLILRNSYVKYGFYFLLSYILSFIILLRITEQDLKNITLYLYNGLELSNGYNEAMAVSGPSWQVYLGLLSIFILTTLFIYFLCTNDKDIILFFILNLLLLFASFKLGFVRHDGHVLTFLGIFIIFIGLILIVLLQEWENKRRTNWMYLCIFLTITILITLIFSINIIAPWILHDDVLAKSSSNKLSANMLENRAIFEGQLKTNKEKVMHDYPLDQQIIKYIGNNTVDVIPWDIALCWAYGLNWSPRPVFQSYSAFTSRLDVINSQHFIGLKAPQAILFSYKSIDGRYPLFDEPATFRTILCNYTYVNSSGEFALLTRSSNKNQDPEVDLGTIVSKFGAFIPVPKYNKGFVFGHLSISHSLLGKSLTVLYKSSPIYIRFKFIEGGVSERFRLIPDNAKNGLFLSEYVESTNDLSSVLQGKMIKDIAIDGIYIEAGNPAEYQDLIKISFKGLPANISSEPEVDQHDLRFVRLLRSVKLPDNQYIKSGRGCINSTCRPIIFHHPEPLGKSTLPFNNITIPKNAVLKFSIALDPQVWSPEKGDGALFEIQILDGGLKETIFSKYINPKNHLEERKWNDYEVNLSSLENRSLTIIFITSSGPKNDNTYDWAWWGDPRLSS